MNNLHKEIAAIVDTYMKKYPMAQAADILKMLYQGEFGPGHLVKDTAGSRQYLEDEYVGMTDICVHPGRAQLAPTEDIGFGFSRLYLHAVAEGLDISTLHRLFLLSTEKAYGAQENFAAKVNILRLLGFDSDETTPFRHSKVFKENYPLQSHYRVVKTEYCRFIPLFISIDSMQGNVTLCIDGDSAAGKTTLARLLQQIYGCNIIHMDSFFLQPHQRTPSRLEQPGGNVDYERFNAEVAMPLAAGKAFTYRPFDCRTMSFGDEINVSPKRITVIEGSYAQHPKNGLDSAINVFLEIDEAAQAARILSRNGAQMAARFREKWIPMEKKYHAAFDIKQKSDLVF